MSDNSSLILSQQTVFVLVHTSDMLIPSGFEIPLESKKTFSAFSLVYNKTLWSSVVECVLEYVRIVFDLFSNERMTSLVIVGSKEKVCISPADSAPHSWRHWMKTLSDIGPPQNAVPSLDPNTAVGVTSVKSILETESLSGLPNGGRVIVLGYKMGENVGHWWDSITAAFNYEAVQNTKNAVTMSEWHFIDVEPATEGIQNDDVQQSISCGTQKGVAHSLFKHTSSANKDLHRTLMSLCERHHELACTLVQNIPMKEDTSNTQSAMYGVELIHPRSALSYISQAGLLPLMTMTHRPFCGFSNCIGIRWVTPKQTHEIEYYNTKNIHRVTTADVCHRASCCLANFVLEGRCVVLEIDQALVPQPASPGLPDFHQELLLLTSHSGVLHLHAFSAHRDPVFDESHTLTLPCLSNILSNKSFSSKLLRTNEFNQMIMANRLMPVVPQTVYQPIDRAFKEIEQQTRYWPELTSDTLIFNKPLMPKVAEILFKKHLDITEKSSCIGFLQQMIFDQSNAEKTANKKTQESKIFKTELEVLLWLQQDRSPAHKDVLDSFDLFSSALSGSVDISSLLKASTGEQVANHHHHHHRKDSVVKVTGLCKLDRLLKNGGAELKNMLKPLDQLNSGSFPRRRQQNNNNNSNSTSGGGGGAKRQLSRPEPGSLTLREVINIAMESSGVGLKRKKFEGELHSVNNVTELYSNITTATVLPAPTGGGATDPRKELLLL